MRIISKQKDYYDSALSFGHDPNVVFERVESSFWINKRNEDKSSHAFMLPSMRATGMFHRGWYDPITNRRGFQFSFYPFTVAFCGKTYPGIEIQYAKLNTYGNEEAKFFYDYESYTDQLHRFGLEYTEDRRRSYAWDKNPLSSPRCEEEVKEYFATTGVDHIAFFAEMRQPIVVCHESPEASSGQIAVDINPILSNFEFYKVFDAYTAFQELDMFISGVMAHDGNPMDNISDTDMRDKKGFDKMSFKTPPTKKR